MAKKRLTSLQIQNIIIFIGLTIVTLAVVALFLLLGKYDYKSVDDFWYCIHGEQLIKAGTGFFGVAKAIWADTWDCYLTWQGTLFATFFTRMLESYIATSHYWVVVWIMLFFIIFPEIYFAISVIHKHYGISFIPTLNIALVFILLQLMTIPYPVEALYWLCGASYYTVFWGLGIIAVTLFLECFWDEKLIKGKFIALCIISVMSALGNLISALVVFSIFAFTCFWAFVSKKRNKYYLLGVFIIFAIFLAVDVFAPGNNIRVTDDTYLTPIGAVIQSFGVAWDDILWCIKMPFVWLGGAIIGIIAYPNIEAKKGRFRLPGAVALLLFLFLTANYVPSMYTLQIAGAGRIRNLERYFCFFFLYGSELYLLGYVKSLIKQKESSDTFKRIPVVLILSIIFGGGMAVSLYKECNRTLTAYSAYLSLRTGQAYRYMLQNEERIAILTDENEPNPTIKLFDDPPYLLLFRDAKDLEDVYADYYGKESITVIE